MLPLLERTETSVHRRFFIMGSYHAPKSRAFFAAADMLSNVTNVNFGGHVMLCCFLDNQPVLVIVLIGVWDAHSISEMGRNVNCHPAA